MAASRELYSNAQLHQYQTLIGIYNGSKSVEEVRCLGPLDFLAHLQKHHMTYVPFEILDLHHSP